MAVPYKVTVTVRMTPKLHEDLKRLGHLERVSLNTLVTNTLRQRCEEAEQLLAADRVRWPNLTER